MKSFLALVFETVRREYVLLGALLVGSGLRLYQLPGQILFGDEWHAIFAANRSGYLQIMSHFGVSDYSIPVALYFKLALNTIGLGECVIRAPFFLAGSLSILVFPLIIRERVGRFTSNLLAWLLALSPPLIFYARFARPYSIAVFTGFIAAVIFFKWQITADRRYAILYVICALISAYSLLVTLPFVLGPFVFFLAYSIIKHQKGRSRAIKRLIGLASLTLLSLLIFLAAPLYYDLAAISSKAVHQAVSLSALGDAFRILMGNTSPFLSITLFTLILIGLIQIYVNSRSFAAYLFALVLIQTLVILMLRPLGTDAPHILARYLLVALPTLLVFVAAGVEAISRFFHGPFKKWGLTALCVSLCLALFLDGPAIAVIQRPNNAITLTMLLRALEGRNYDWMLKRIPRFYQTLAVHPPASLTIVEAPFLWQANHLPLYQKIHRQQILMGLMEDLYSKRDNAPTLMPQQTKGFHTIVDLSDREALREAGADFVVFHKDLQNEIRVPMKAYGFQQDIRDGIEQYRLWFGKPVFEDEAIVVFEVPDG